VSFTLVHTGKYSTENILKTDSTQTKHNPEKANNTKHSNTEPPWFSHFLRQSARKRGELILQRSRAQTGQHIWMHHFHQTYNIAHMKLKITAQQLEAADQLCYPFTCVARQLRGNITCTIDSFSSFRFLLTLFCRSHLSFYARHSEQTDVLNDWTHSRPDKHMSR